jgi:hypothetical protein
MAIMKGRRTSSVGTANAHHPKNVICLPARRSSMPMPMMLGGVPTGVPIPPTEAPKLTASMRPVA